MQVVVKEIVAYQLETVDGEKIGEFSKGREWHGMTAFTGPSGTLIADTPTVDITDFFKFGSTKLLQVVKASPEIMQRLTKKQPESAKQEGE